jgi:hypothetical protein
MLCSHADAAAFSGERGSSCGRAQKICAINSKQGMETTEDDSVKANSIRASRDYGRHKTVELINMLKQRLILRGLLQLYFMNQNQIAL